MARKSDRARKQTCDGVTGGVTVVFCLQAKVRRLYDIANVLTSLALIKKVHVTEERGRKPAFKWIGPVDFSSSGEAWLRQGPV